jgi:hypothetical protein
VDFIYCWDEAELNINWIPIFIFIAISAEKTYSQKYVSREMKERSFIMAKSVSSLNSF